MMWRAGDVRRGADCCDRDGDWGEAGLPVLHRGDRTQGRHEQGAPGMGIQGQRGQLQATQSAVERRRVI